jgi:hypothetical protein
LKSEKKDTSNAKKDNSEFSKIIASFFAIEGSVAQLKLSLKKHADQNGFPVDGLGLDDAITGASSEAPEATTTEPAPVEAAPAPAPPQPETENGMNAAAVAAGTGALAATALAADQLTSGENAESLDAAGATSEVASAPEQPAPDASATTIPEVDLNSESGSESDESDLEEIPVNQGESTMPVDGSAAASEAPVPGAESMAPAPGTELAPATAEAPAQGEATTAPASGTEPNELFSGGKNHYLQSLKKNKTHRHHKRRNRHQTLRK